MKSDNFEKINIDEAFKILKTSRNGLSDSEARNRILQYGYNEIKSKKQNSILNFIKKFYGPIPFMLEAVMLITFFIHDMKDFYVILILLIFNSIVSFFEENKADNAIELLKKRVSINTRALRSGNWKILEARDLVKGDIIRIRIGDIIPSDAKIIEQSMLQVDQSVLTGESMPVEKKVNNIIYSGSVVKDGEATCLVIATGYDTYYGYTTQLIQKAGTKSHLESIIFKITRYLISFDIVIVLIILLFGLFIVHESFFSMLPFALIILIASVPVALPAAFTVTMALGTNKMTTKSVLVTKLDEIEEISTLNIICFDKTGTLTENKIEIKEIFELKGYTKEDVLKIAFFASRKEDNDPIDNAVINYVENNKLIIKDYIIKKFIPFQPKTKTSYSELIYKHKSIIAMKGAYNIIKKITKNDKKIQEILDKKVEEFSKFNYRTIAIAIKDPKPKILGIIALYDKPRQSAKNLIKELSNLSIDTKMLTGDNLRIAQEISKEVGISKTIVDFSELRNKTEVQINEKIKNSGGFAEIFPEDKYIIVKSLQKSNYKVGMTGDGINDAPALKQAEVGIAVENATDVAKSVAGIVLLKNGLDVIIDAVKESRRIFERMMTYAMLKIIRVIQIVLFIMIGFFILKQMPILAFELILLIFTNDIVNITISTDNASYSRKPDTWNIKNISYISLLLGIFFLFLSLLFIPLGKYLEPTIGAFQTFIFFMFVVTDKFLIYSLRNKKSIFSTKPSKWLVFSSIIGISAGAVISYFGFFITPISLYSLFTVIALSFAIILIFDIIKIRVYNKFEVMSSIANEFNVS